MCSLLPWQCERGSALHEAALFGKIDAVKLLLNRGKRRLCQLMHQLYLVCAIRRNLTRNRISAAIISNCFDISAVCMPLCEIYVWLLVN